ncbi:MAG TPA: type 1 glutamine amidotransferase domain-containing protein [archaeon]|nr:type 1 glutamine amidotransferase domain-containing protein [archaeon]
MKKVLIFAAEGFEDNELLYPYYRLQEAGCDVKVVGLGESECRGKHGVPVKCDGKIEDFNADDFDVVIIPGGWAPDKLRRSKAALDFVRRMDAEKKLIASICHGPHVLVSADILKGRKLTCVSAIKDDVVNAGGIYSDEPVVIDGNLITSRTPADLPAFCLEIVKRLGE